MIRENEQYGELLQRPEWKWFRVVVADNAQHHCQRCGKYLVHHDFEMSGEAHHTKYTAKNPWEEPLENMQYLCHDCHEAVHGRKFGWSARSKNVQSVGAVIQSIVSNM